MQCDGAERPQNFRRGRPHGCVARLWIVNLIAARRFTCIVWHKTIPSIVCATGDASKETIYIYEKKIAAQYSGYVSFVAQRFGIWYKMKYFHRDSSERKWKPERGQASFIRFSRCLRNQAMLYNNSRNIFAIVRFRFQKRAIVFAALAMSNLCRIICIWIIFVSQRRREC